MMEDRIDRIQRFARMWWQSRAEGKKSQEYMALALGVSKKTIQNWEKGMSAPDLFQGAEWFRILGLNPLRYFSEFLYPDMTGDSDSEKDATLAAEALHSIIDGLSGEEQRDLLYMLTGSHGSTRRGVLEMMTAYCHISLAARVGVARQVMEQYEMASANDALVCPEEKQPVLSVLEESINTAKQAVCEGKTHYNLQKD